MATGATDGPRLAYQLKLGVAGKLSSQLIDVDAGYGAGLTGRIHPSWRTRRPVPRRTERAFGATGPVSLRGAARRRNRPSISSRDDTIRKRTCRRPGPNRSRPRPFRLRGVRRIFASPDAAFSLIHRARREHALGCQISDLYFKQDTFRITCFELEPAVAYGA